MATARPFAYNPSQTIIPGVSLFGYLSVADIGTVLNPNGSILFNSSPSQYLSIPNNTGFTQNQAFTIECWFYPTTLNGGYVWAMLQTNFLCVAYRNNGKFIIDMSYVGNPPGYSTLDTTYPINNWYHIALVWNGTSGKLFINGSIEWTFTGAGALVNAGNPLLIGQYQGQGQLTPLGNISNFRVVKGTAVYTSAFTPPTSPLTAISGTQLLLNTYNTNFLTDSSTNNFTVTNNGSVTSSSLSPFPSINWWNGPNEDLGYVIAKVVPDNTQPTPIVGVSASVAFYRSATFSEAAFLNIVNKGLHLNYSVGTDASNYLLSNGYWTNYPTFAYDPDALIYMNALNSTIDYFPGYNVYYDPMVVNQLFLDLKTNGLYNKMEAFYPMLGNNALSQSINAKSVSGVRQDQLDLVFYGGWDFTYGVGDQNKSRGNSINTYIGVDKKYYDLTSLKNTHFAVYSFPGINISTAAADVFVFDPSTSNGLNYRFVEMRLALSPNGYSYGFNYNNRDYNTVYAYPGNIPDGTGPTQNDNGYSNNYSFAIMSYDNYSDDGTNNFSINGYNYYNSGTPPADPAYTPYGADLIFGYYYDWYNSQVMYTGAEYGWLGFGTFLDMSEQSNYQSIVNAFMIQNGKSNY